MLEAFNENLVKTMNPTSDLLVYEASNHTRGHNDFEHITERLRKQTGKTKWAEIFADGRRAGLYEQYRSATILKSAYHNYMSHQTKRKRN